MFLFKIKNKKINPEKHDDFIYEQDD